MILNNENIHRSVSVLKFSFADKTNSDRLSRGRGTEEVVPGSTRNRVTFQKKVRGFESHPLRHFPVTIAGIHRDRYRNRCRDWASKLLNQVMPLCGPCATAAIPIGCKCTGASILISVAVLKRSILPPSANLARRRVSALLARRPLSFF
jgi:hypothetical protein